MSTKEQVYAYVMLIGLCAIWPGVAMSETLKYQAFKIELQYEYDAEAYETDKQTAKKHLTNAMFYDSRGNVAERWDIEENNGNPRYIRNVFTYDRAGRKSAHLEYVSASLGPDERFSVSRTRAGIEILPKVADVMRTVAVFEYDRRGNMLVMRKSDGDGNLQHKVTMSYDAAGRQISFHNAKGDGTVLCTSSSKWSDGGRRQEEVYSSCYINHVKKVVRDHDNDGRQILEEQFFISSDGELVLTSRAVSTFKGKLRRMDWSIWNPNGEPTKRLLIIDEGDEERSYSEFAPASPAERAACRPNEPMCGWIPALENVFETSHDERGNQLRQITRTRPSPNKPFSITKVVEWNVYYF